MSNDGARSITAVGLAAAGVFALPVLFLLQQVVDVGAPLTEALVDPANLAPLGRSLLLGGSVAVSTGVLGSVCAFLVTRTDVAAPRSLSVLLALPLVLPSYIGAFTLQAALATGGLVDRLFGVSVGVVEGFWAAWAILTVLTAPYVFLLVGARLRQVPDELEESARLLGSSRLQVLWRVTLPQVRGALLAGMLLVFLYTVSDFGLPQLLRYDTLTRVIFANLLDRPLALALGVHLAVLALLSAALQRSVDGDAAPGQRRGLRTGGRWSLGRARVPATLGLVGVIGASLLAPLAVLVYWAGRGLLAGSSRSSSVFSDPSVLVTPLVGSVLAGVLAAVAAAIVSLPVAVLTARRRGTVPAVANSVVVAGFALPGLLIALALTFFTLRGPGLAAGLYQTLPLLVLAYVVHFGAQSLGASQVAVAALPDELLEASRTLGVRRTATLFRVALPLMAPSLLAGAGLVLLSTLKELPATLLLSPPGFRTLATEVWAATTDAFWGEAALLALVLVAASAALTWLLVLRRADALA